MPVALSLMSTSVGPDVVVSFANLRDYCNAIVHTWLRHVDILHLDMEIWTFVHHDTSFARLRNIVCLDFLFCHVADY